MTSVLRSKIGLKVTSRRLDPRPTPLGRQNTNSNAALDSDVSTSRLLYSISYNNNIIVVHCIARLYYKVLGIIRVYRVGSRDARRFGLNYMKFINKYTSVSALGRGETDPRRLNYFRFGENFENFRRFYQKRVFVVLGAGGPIGFPKMVSFSTPKTGGKNG